MIVQATNMKRIREEIVEYIKSKGFKKVIDVGGSMYPWAREVVTAYFDLMNPHEYLKDSDLNDDNLKRAMYFKGDISRYQDWGELLAYTSLNGKFDFAICTQTLEDIRDPVTPLDLLPLIANEGLITVPSKYRECCRHGIEWSSDWGLTGHYLGYSHHRWIFSFKDDTLWLFPKLASLEHCEGIEVSFEEQNKYCDELSFHWRDSIAYEIVNQDFMGPNPAEMFDYFRKNLREGL